MGIISLFNEICEVKHAIDTIMTLKANAFCRIPVLIRNNDIGLANGMRQPIKDRTISYYCVARTLQIAYRTCCS